MGFIKFIKDRKDYVKVDGIKMHKETYENLTDGKEKDDEQLKSRKGKNNQSK